MNGRKRISIIIVLCILLLASCSEVKQTGTEKPEERAVADTIKQTEDEREVLVWRIAAPFANEQEADGMVSVWTGAFNEVLKEKGADYQVKIESFMTTEGSGVSQKTAADELAKLQSAGEQTDVISLLPPLTDDALNGYDLTYPECARRGLLMPLDSLIESEEGEKLREEIPEKDLKRAKLDGVTYGISSVLPSVQAVLYSREQMEQYGIAPKELEGSIFDKEELLQKVKEKTGKAPYWVISGDVRRRLGLWIVDPVCNLAMDTDGKFVNVTETPEFESYLKKFAEWKKKGILGILGTLESAQTGMPFAQDMYENYTDTPYYAELEADMGDGTRQKTQVLAVPDERAPVIAPYWGDYKLCIAAWSEKQEKAWDLLEKLMTDSDLANILQFGREGQEYVMDGDTLQMQPEANVFLRFFGYQYTNPLITRSTAEMAKEKKSYVERFHKVYGEKIPDGFRFDPKPVLKQIVETNKVFGDVGGSETAGKIARLEMEDVDRTIAEITKELKNAGMDEIVQEANRQLGEWRERNS